MKKCLTTLILFFSFVSLTTHPVNALEKQVRAHTGKMVAVMGTATAQLTNLQQFPFIKEANELSIQYKSCYSNGPFVGGLTVPATADRVDIGFLTHGVDYCASIQALRDRKPVGFPIQQKLVFADTSVLGTQTITPEQRAAKEALIQQMKQQQQQNKTKQQTTRAQKQAQIEAMNKLKKNIQPTKKTIRTHTGQNAIVLGDAKATASWTPRTDAQGYIIYYRDNTQEQYQYALKGQANSQQVDINYLDPSKTYYFRVGAMVNNYMHWTGPEKVLRSASSTP